MRRSVLLLLVWPLFAFATGRGGDDGKTQCDLLMKALRPFENNDSRVPTSDEWQALTSAVFHDPEGPLCSAGLAQSAIDIAVRRVTPDVLAAEYEKSALARSGWLLRPIAIRLATRSHRPRKWLLSLLRDDVEPEVTRVILPIIEKDTQLGRQALPLVIALLHKSRNVHVRTDAALFVRNFYGPSTQLLLLAADTGCEGEFRRNIQKQLDANGRAALETLCDELDRQ